MSLYHLRKITSLLVIWQTVLITVFHIILYINILHVPTVSDGQQSCLLCYNVMQLATNLESNIIVWYNICKFSTLYYNKKYFYLENGCSKTNIKFRCEAHFVRHWLKLTVLFRIVFVSFCLPAILQKAMKCIQFRFTSFWIGPSIP